MDHRSPGCTHKIVNMFPATEVFGVVGAGRKRTEVLSGMIVWNVLMLVLLVLAVCVQGKGGAVPSDASPLSALKPSPESGSVKKQSAGDPAPAVPTENTALPPQSSQGSDSGEPQNPKAIPKSSEQVEETGKGGGGAAQGGKAGGGDAQATSENKSGSANTTTTKENTESESLPSHLPSMSTEAVLRGFYVFVGIGAIILVYIVIKLARLRKRRAPGKYRVLSHTDDQEMFPLAAGEGEDEEIFNAAHHQPRK